MQKPTKWTLFLGFIPFAAMCFSVPLWDRIHPMILGLPFNLFWLMAWIVLTSGCLWIAARIEDKRS